MHNVGERVLLKSGSQLQAGTVLEVMLHYRVQTDEGESLEVEEARIIGTPPQTPLTEDDIARIGKEQGVSLRIYADKAIYLVYEGSVASYFCKLAKAQLLTEEQFTQMLEERIRRDAAC